MFGKKKSLTVRSYSPHQDATVLHSPGQCVRCDMYPEWQEYRNIAMIAFTNLPDDQRSPCPSTWPLHVMKRQLWLKDINYNYGEAYNDTNEDKH